MAKRFQPMKEFGRSMKKPKLDISICKGPTNNLPSTTRGQGSRKVSPLKCSPSNFWDDDDDDVILLATQVAEAAVAAERQCDPQEINHEFRMSETEITFSEFIGGPTASTQHPATSTIPGQEMLTQMFEDGDDFDLLAAVEKEEPEILKRNSVFLPPPLAPSQAKNILWSTGNAPKKSTPNESMTRGIEDINSVADTSIASSKSVARRQLASERQIKFLMERVDALKKENSKLSSDLSDTKAKMMSKEGEASLLRDEVRHMKLQAQNMKMEKLITAETAKNECQAKITELSKKVEAQKAEIQLKEAQTYRLKMRYADEAQKLHQSLCMDSIQQIEKKTSPESKTTKYAKCLMKLNCLDLNSAYEQMPAAHISPFIFEPSQERGSTKKQRTVFQLELENIQILLSQMQLPNFHTTPQSYKTKCVESVCRVLTEFWSYIHSLEYLKNCKVCPYQECVLSDTNIICSHRRLHQPSEIHDDERCISLRRYFAALAIICRKMPSIAKLLLQYKHGEYMLLQIASDSVSKLGFSCEIREHFGVLESLSVWLRSLLISITTQIEECYLETLLDFIKQIVFTRPSPWIYREISLCLIEFCRIPYLLNNLCVNSSQQTFVADRVRSLHRFSNDSCFLQVYCSLLEIAFNWQSRLHLEYFKMLAMICLNHVRFTYHCFVKPPNFVRHMLPNYDDDVGDGAQDNTTEAAMSFETTEQNSDLVSSSSNVTSSKTSCKVESSSYSCQCYIKLCLSVVTLLYHLMRQWMYTKEHCTAEVAEISRLGVQLLNLIFYENYTPNLFGESEATTKHYLCLITKWWLEYSRKLQFDDLNLKLLQKLLDSHAIPKDIEAQTDYNNINLDLAKWQKATKDDVSTLLGYSEREAKETTKRLRIMDEASNKDIFFEGLKGFAFNFQ